MLLRGILIGFGVALVSIPLFLKWIPTQFPPMSGPVAYSIETYRRLALSFFGGMGIGVGVAATVVIAGTYAVLFYAKRAAGTP